MRIQVKYIIAHCEELHNNITDPLNLYKFNESNFLVMYVIELMTMIKIITSAQTIREGKIPIEVGIN